MLDLFMDIVGVLVESLRHNTRVRAWVTGVSASVVVLATILLAITGTSLIFEATAAAVLRDSLPVVLGFSAFSLFIALISFTPLRFKGGTVRLELESLQEERQRLRERIREKPKPDVMDTIQLNLNQLSEYYAINKSQARSSFRFSVFSVVAGLATLIAGVWLFYFQSNQNLQLTVISGLAGTLVQFIGAAYFYLYRRSLEQLNFFFNQLVRMQDTMLAVRLCDQLSPQERQVAVREKIILTLLERSAQALDVSKGMKEAPNTAMEPTAMNG